MSRRVNHLFTYGSLVVPDLMRVVTGGEHRHAAASLAGFERFLLQGRVYPGIVACAGGATPGRVYFDLGDAALDRLDYYESDEYVRERVEVVLESRERISAFAYVIPPAQRHLVSDRRWDEAAFMAHHLEDFLASTRHSMRLYEERSR